jgi:hypothetical protein
LEEGAEDFGLDFGPVGFGGLAEEDEFLVEEFKFGGGGEEAPVEVGNAFITAAGFRSGVVHGFKKAANEVVGVGGGMAIFEDLGDEVFGKKADVFGEEGDEHLEDEFLSHGPIDAAFGDVTKTEGEFVGGFTSDGFAVVVEGGFLAAEEGESAPAFGEVGEGEFVFWGVDVRFEIVNPEFVEVAEDDVARAIRDEAGPVVEGLAIVFLEGFAAFLHFDEDDGFPDEVGEGGSAAVFSGFADAVFGLAARFEDARVIESLEETIKEDLGLSFFVAGNVFRTPVYECGKLLGIRHSADI